MSRLNYVIDENDIQTVKGLDETAKNAPDPEVILDIQGTLAQALQLAQMPQGEAQAPANASAQWGRASNG